jgi:hypothetical protein
MHFLPSKHTSSSCLPLANRVTRAICFLISLRYRTNILKYNDQHFCATKGRVSVKILSPSRLYLSPLPSSSVYKFRERRETLSDEKLLFSGTTNTIKMWGERKSQTLSRVKRFSAGNSSLRGASKYRVSANLITTLVQTCSNFNFLFFCHDPLSHFVCNFRFRALQEKL